MADLGGFNANDVAPTSFDVVPNGEYDVIITSSAMKPTKDGGGKFLELELQILAGECQNRKLWDRLNLENANAKAVQIARGTLSAICRAVGVMTPRDSSELHNKPLRAKVIVKKDDEYGERNEIKAYKPRHAAPPPPMTPPSAPAPAPVDPSARPW